MQGITDEDLKKIALTLAEEIFKAHEESTSQSKKGQPTTTEDCPTHENGFY